MWSADLGVRFWLGGFGDSWSGWGMRWSFAGDLVGGASRVGS